MWIGISENILFNSTGKIFSGLQKKIYPIKKLEEDIKIDVRSVNPISFELYNIPVVIVYFEITNMSQYLTLTLDRLIFDLWLKSEHGTQPLLHKAHSVEKEEKEPPSATIYLKAYFNSRLYEVEKVINLENMPCKIEG